MSINLYKYIYGPVPSWRLGSSLGIDPVSSNDKICSFDCLYCQLWKTKHFTEKRNVFVPVEKIIEELDSLPSLQIDYITFSGVAEPTLAKNLGQMIRGIKSIRNEKIAVLTNSSLLHKKDVQHDLLQADLVVAKLDAASQEVFEVVNRPMSTIKFDMILQAIKNFKAVYKGKLALQIMFIEENKNDAADIAKMVKEINPDEVQLNTPLRPCGVKPISESEMNIIKKHFRNLNSISVYESEKKKVMPISNEDTLRRRGKI